jgi:SSS family solute:Na+ symporter
MQAVNNRKLGIFSLATLLVSAHYGLGFLLGTSEQALTVGAAGSLYPVCLGLGTLVLLALVKFYWTEVEQIWTLLGNRYGKSVKILVGLMSWASLIGIEAVQIIAGSSILAVLRIPVLPSTIFLALAFILLSLLPVEKASWIFRGLLLFNILALIYVLSVLHGLPSYWELPFEFVSSLDRLSPIQVGSISVSTIAIVTIDMKYQQFLVQAKDLRSLYFGCLLAGIVLISLAFLPSAVVIAAQNAHILPLDLNSREVIPYILSWVGGGSDRPLGVMLILALAVPSLGIGSSVLRVQNKTILDLLEFNILPNFDRNRLLVATLNALLALSVALIGGSIIGLIVSFYAAYLAAVWVPLIAYFLDRIRVYTFSETSVKLSLRLSSIVSLLTLAITLIKPDVVIFDSAQLTIMIIGVFVGGFSLLISHLIFDFRLTILD